MEIALSKEGKILIGPCFFCYKPDIPAMDNEFGPYYYRKKGDDKLYNLPSKPPVCDPCFNEYVVK